MGKTKTQARTHGSSVDPNPQKDATGTSRKAIRKLKQSGNEGNGPFLTKMEIKTYWSNLRGRPIRPTKFYHEESMNMLGDHIGLESMFRGMGWGDFLSLCDRT